MKFKSIVGVAVSKRKEEEIPSIDNLVEEEFDGLIATDFLPTSEYLAKFDLAVERSTFYSRVANKTFPLLGSLGGMTIAGMTLSNPGSLVF